VSMYVFRFLEGCVVVSCFFSAAKLWHCFFFWVFGCSHPLFRFCRPSGFWVVLGTTAGVCELTIRDGLLRFFVPFCVLLSLG